MNPDKEQEAKEEANEEEEEVLTEDELESISGGCGEADTKTVGKAFKVEINGQFLPVKSYSGGDPAGESESPSDDPFKRTTRG